ncbi:MAG TPA: glycerophosphodiester phosphodiesterase [Longimicrobiaceae bacterium]|nr:glycerophosphodiester phosphodiesterase [Longimicrobiaceae bacterium]
MPERRTRLLLGALALGVPAGTLALQRAAAACAPGHPYLAGAPLLMAHRGGSALAPENTLLALRRATEWWDADILEIDVQPTRDGEAVVMHDSTVDRTTDGSGRVADLTLDQLRELDAGYRSTPDGGRSFPFRGRGIGISTLREVLEALPGSRVNLEIKKGRAQERVWETIHALDAAGRVLVAAGQRANRARFATYRGPTSAAREELYTFLLLHRMHAAALYVPGVHAFQVPETAWGRRVLSPRFVREAQAKNLALHVWTVNAEADMRRLLEWGVDGIITDRPDRLARVLHEVVDRPLPPGPPPGEAEPFLERLLRS